MKRLLATIIKDIVLQARYGFYFATLFVAAIYIAILRQIPSVSLSYVLPYLMVSNLMITAYFFLAGQILFEKGEGTLEAMIVTPVRSAEFLLSKTISLALLGIIEGLLLVVASFGLKFNFLYFAIALLLLAVLMILLGFIVVARYDSINEFILPGVVFMMPLSLPFIDYFELWTSWIFDLHPVQLPLQLMRFALDPQAPGPSLLATVATGLWITGLFRWAQTAFGRFIIRKGSRQ
ncbi:MAG: ABC transporter permease [Candidatus Neomarinimicrobiota bacterium]